eukprot:21709-Eustigmatos_ZCMA.PRE.1
MSASSPRPGVGSMARAAICIHTMWCTGRYSVDMCHCVRLNVVIYIDCQALSRVSVRIVSKVRARIGEGKHISQINVGKRVGGCGLHCKAA